LSSFLARIRKFDFPCLEIFTVTNCSGQEEGCELQDYVTRKIDVPVGRLREKLLQGTYGEEKRDSGDMNSEIRGCEYWNGQQRNHKGKCHFRPPYLERAIFFQ
jgi:hypothetical protein